MSSSSPSLTVSAPAQTTTHTIPNLKGGANPATPKLAGIITGSCVLLAWVVCFIYWWWNRRREKQGLAEMEANQKMKEVNGRISPSYVTTGPMRRTRSRAASSATRLYPPGTAHADDKSEGERATLAAVAGDRNRASIRASDGPRAQSPTAVDSRSKSPPSRGRRPLEPSHHHGRAELPGEPPHHGTGPLTPMKEVPTRDEAPSPPPKR
ncbi:hypothetical protein M407DRAFT_245501 [Tulasnella calospora MUT 4182]|uniref:Uncharacterized protein n=1 Tax=Tulasnella calospora MUT 4182 TaxID=1051891 RepID=A0A0C3Q9P2_9AGAM|nr:hypothetical protein M407DRAFT_245501 [Tulasnella calospora MUT 4182]